MNWDDLRLFLSVARCGSISGGAKQLGVQHSTISRRMRHLEENLGARLFERKQGGYELTQAGANLMEAALRMEREMLGVDGALLGTDTELSGPLRVSAINNMASSALMPIFAGFSTLHPRVELHVIVSNDDASLAAREADVAIRLTNTPPETLIGREVVKVASAVYGSRAYLAQLRQQDGEAQWIGVECCGFHKAWTKQACGGQAHRFVSDDTLLTMAAIREGLGVSYLPCFMGDADSQLSRMRDPDPEHELGLWVLLHPDLKRTARVLAFRDYLADAIQAQRDLFEGNGSAAGS